MKRTDRVGWSREAESAWTRAFGRAEYIAAVHYYFRPNADGELEQVGEERVSANPSVAPQTLMVDDCAYCGAKDVGPEHHGYAPALCKEN